MNPLLRSGGNAGGGSVMSVFERKQEHYQHLRNMFMPLPESSHLIADHAGGRSLDVKPDVGWPELGSGGGYDDQMGYGYMSQNTVLKMTSCNPAGVDQSFQHGNSASVSVSVTVSPRKRKADKSQSPKVVSEKDKKIKECVEDKDTKIIQSQNNNNNNSNSNSKETSVDTWSKEKSKVLEVQKPDYIHVRARRGQATDSHSLAERVRREKISERMKYLQDLVPGCNKITGKAGMLDEIINYVQSLQKQVEFLSMKLATVNPELDFNIDNIFTKESSTSEFPALGCSSETYFQLNSLEQVVSYCGPEMGLNTTEMALRRSISTPVSAPETFVDSSYFNQIQPSATWDADLQNLYKMKFQQETLIPFQSHQFTAELHHAITPWAEAKIQKKINKSATWTVFPISESMYEVHDHQKNGTVDFRCSTCTCRKWQLSGLPCGHVIAIMRWLNHRDVHGWAMHWYTADVYRATYLEEVYPVGNPSEWELPDDIITVKPPVMDKRQSGRPRNRDRIPSQGEGTIQKKCSRCNKPGHTRLSCRNPFPAEVFVGLSSRSASDGRQIEFDSNNTQSYSFQNVDLNK